MSLFIHPYVVPNLCHFLSYLEHIEIHFGKLLVIFWKNVGNKVILVTTDFHNMEKNTYLKISSFMFHRGKKDKQFWKHIRVSK